MRESFKEKLIFYLSRSLHANIQTDPIFQKKKQKRKESFVSPYFPIKSSRPFNSHYRKKWQRYDSTKIHFQPNEPVSLTPTQFTSARRIVCQQPGPQLQPIIRTIIKVQSASINRRLIANRFAPYRRPLVHKSPDTFASISQLNRRRRAIRGGGRRVVRTRGVGARVPLYANRRRHLRC